LSVSVVVGLIVGGIHVGLSVGVVVGLIVGGSNFGLSVDGVPVGLRGGLFVLWRRGCVFWVARAGCKSPP
jgi:hypothetical protein